MYVSAVTAGADAAEVAPIGVAPVGGREWNRRLVIPAGKTATLSNAQFGDVLLPTAPLAPNTATNCPGDPLAYGYQLNLGAKVQIATGGMGCQIVAGGGDRASSDRGAAAGLAD